MTMKSMIFLMMLVLFLSASAWAEPAMSELENQFKNLPADARRLTGPLFWLHGDESREVLESNVDKVAEGGDGCFTAESRPHSDWLGEGWYRDLGICLDAAKRNGLQMWIFDEKWWPSGEVAGKVPQEFGSKFMEATAHEAKGPGAFSLELPDNLIAVIAGRNTDAGIDGSSLTDLTGLVADRRVTWPEVPPGTWTVMVFTWRFNAGDRRIVDGASRDAIDWYIKTVYQPHYDRFPDDFGKTIRGYFYDEPETQGDWGAEVIPMLKERGVDWMKALVAHKFTLAGDDQAAAQYQYIEAFAEAWGRTMYGGISQWCRDHGVLSIGHFLEHKQLYLNPVLCAGDLFQLQKYSGMGAIDAVFSQFKMGQREASDTPCWQTPKLGSSVSHAYGKTDDIAMVEIFGARGQDLTYPEMKWWADHMQVSGINFLIPHSFNPRAPYDNDCPPYFYNGGYEPRWPLYRVFADYTSRLSVMLSGGRHVCPVAFLFCGQSAHVGKAIPPDTMSEMLQDALFDCDWLPYEVFENDMSIDAATLRLRDERYRVLIVPPVEVIPYPALEKARAFFDQGGVVAGYGFLPSKSATLGKPNSDIASLVEAIWGAPEGPSTKACKTSPAGGRAYLLAEKPAPEEIVEALARDAGVRPTIEVLEGKTDHWLHVLHRVKSGRDVFFICNQNSTGASHRFRLSIAAKGEPECWDAMRNEITSVECTRKDGRAIVDLTLEPLESVLLVFQPEKRPLPKRIGPDAKPTATFAAVRDAYTVPEVSPPNIESAEARELKGCSWVWYPEENPAVNAAPGKCWFRKTIAIDKDRAIESANFMGAADNAFVLRVNGKTAGDGNNAGWNKPTTIDIKPLLHPGNANLLIGIIADNATENPNPAGLIGRVLVKYADGTTTTVRVDGDWQCSRKPGPDWLDPSASDKGWVAAKVLGELGMAPWGTFSQMLTLSPVKADPFVGHVDLPSPHSGGGRNPAGLPDGRICLEMQGVAPEAAARVYVNGNDAGGVIGEPLRIDVTKYVKPGKNDLKIEPFAPATVSLSFWAGRPLNPRS